MSFTSYAGGALLAAAALSLGAPAHAQLTQLESAGQLGGADTTLNFTGAGFVPSPFTQTAGGNTLTFTAASGPLLYLQPSDGMMFDFVSGTNLLETTAGGGADGPLIIDFSQGISEFGLSAQDFASDTEAFSVIAYDGSSAVGGFSTNLVDNSMGAGTAQFLGGSVGPGQAITRLSISSVSSEAGAANDFVIGPVSYGAPVPEASSSIGLGVLLALGGLALVARKRLVSAK